MNGFVKRFSPFFVTGNRCAVALLLVLSLLGTVGCASQNTDNPHDDWVLLSSSQEKDMGRSAARRLEEEIGLYDVEPLQRYVDNVGSRVAVYSERPDLEYEFKILDAFVVNALALPGGYVYVTRGLLRHVDSESELAGVLAHEVAHVAAYHAVKRQQWSVVTLLASLALAAETGGEGLGGGLLARESLRRGYTRSSEEEADRLGMRYAVRAGYDPSGMRAFLTTLQELNDRTPNRELVFMRTHPFLSDRIRTARKREPELRKSLSGQPTVNRARYQRFRRQHLFRPGERTFLTRFRSFVDAYRQQDLTAIKSMLHPDFYVGREDAGETTSDFVRDLERRFKRTRKIEYEYKLLDLDVGDTDATVFYEYEGRRWKTGRDQPVLSDGRQQLIWRKQDGPWLLIRLR